jgi:FkbM family methyltransferase
MWDTLVLGINAIVWQIHKLLYKISHPSATKRDFAQYIASKKPNLYWNRFPFDVREKLLYDSSVRLWIDVTGITWLYYSTAQECPSEWFSMMSPGQIGMDIGAHRGFWSLLHYHKLWPGGLIFALEPNPENYRNLIRVIAKNKISNIVPLPMAAWSKGTLLSLEFGIDSFTSRVKEGKGNDVLAISIDGLVESLSLPRLDWIKMDIEGAEVEALRGAMKTLLRYRPTLWIEFHDTLQEVKALLAEANYEIKGELHLSTFLFREYGHLWAVPQAPVS